MKLTLLFMLALGCAVATAREQLPLQPIDRSTGPDEKKCSEYFFTTTFGGTVPEQIVFAYQPGEGGVKRYTISRKHAIVELGDHLTYERTWTTDEGEGAIFTLNNGEYTKAQACLPQPKSKTPVL